MNMNPYGQYYGAYNPQPYQNTMAQPQQQNQNSLIWVQGESGAKSYLVAPGNTVLLMDSERSAFYLKSADTAGMPMPLRVFEYQEKTDQAKTPQPAEDYVTRQEYDQLIRRCEDIERRMERKKKMTREEFDESTIQRIRTAPEQRGADDRAVQ